ncbi:MAG TPA: CHAT domain-containing protein [Pyrinomonadaceae bacterium]|nr:CHAT domain-containing protein [Pyrinomonadaceae bacterium]
MNCIRRLRSIIVFLAFAGLSGSVLSQTLRTAVPDPVVEFANQLVAAGTNDERNTLLASSKELVTRRLGKILIQKGNVLLTNAQYAKAFDVYGLAKRVAVETNDKDGIATALLDIGTVHYLQANYTSALEHYQQARELFVQVGNSYEAAKALSGVALIYKERGRQPEALKAFQQVLQEFEALNDKEEMANALSSIGTLYYEQKKYAEASSAFLKSTELNSNADNTIRIADSFYMQGDYAEASNYYKKSLSALDGQDNAAGVISALSGAANSAYYQGNYDEALEYFQKNAAAQERQGDTLGLATSLRGAGNVYRSRGDFGRALENYQHSLRIAAQIKAPKGTTLGSIGLVRALQGENAQALDYYNQALAEFEAADNKIDTARVLSLIGNAYFTEGNYPAALESYRRGLTVRETMEDKPGRADLLLGIGTVQLRMNAPAQALDSYQRALTLFEAADHKQGIALAVSRIAETQLQQLNYNQALNFAERAAVLGKQIESNEVLWYARLLAGRAQRGLDQPAAALQSLLESITIVEGLRGRPPTSQSNADRSGVLPYLAAMDLLLELGRASEAFEFAERAKVQSLIELLRRSNALSVKGISVGEQTEERKLAGNVVSLELQLDREAVLPNSNENRRATLRERLNQARTLYGSFQKRLFVAHPSLKVERGELAALSREQLRPLLSDSRTALLEYAIAENKVYLFVLTSDATTRKIGKSTRGGAQGILKVYQLAMSVDALIQRVTSLHQLIVKKDESFGPPASELYELLIKPAEEQLAGKTKFVIVPHGILWGVPFEALKPAHNQYLIERVAISYSPSLSALHEMMKKPGPQNRARALGLSAFANPQLSKDLLQLIELTYKNEKVEPSPDEEDEVVRLRNIYGEKVSRSFIGPQASEEQARSEIARAGILHFAGPSLLDDFSPMYSFLALSSTSGNDDGLLQFREILNLQTPARLVVLSASRSRNDRVATGGGATGLAWSWFVAGSPSTVFSRWQVESPSRSRLMADFHSQLRSRTPNSKARALQQSALSVRRSAAYQHPYYWAGFSLIGDPR